MNVANALTVSRLFLAPIFLLFYFIPIWTGGLFTAGSVVLLWLLFAVIEVTDILDGHYARSRNQVTDLGKLLDPYADVISRLTYFVCFATTGLMPVWMFVILMYREFSIGLIRTMFSKYGVALAARRGGKTKALAYSVSGGAGLVILTMNRLKLSSAVEPALRVVMLVIFSIAVFFSLLSLADYLSVFFRDQKRRNAGSPSRAEGDHAVSGSSAVPPTGEK
jgi:CDP-diacylglycerol--glycerol-3-phosphate 3-phosphatidyltransferase